LAFRFQGQSPMFSDACHKPRLHQSSDNSLVLIVSCEAIDGNSGNRECTHASQNGQREQLAFCPYRRVARIRRPHGDVAEIPLVIELRTISGDIEVPAQQLAPGLSPHIERLIGNASRDDREEISAFLKFAVP
jgi:hypothetical protein